MGLRVLESVVLGSVVPGVACAREAFFSPPEVSEDIGSEVIGELAGSAESISDGALGDFSPPCGRDLPVLSDLWPDVSSAFKVSANSPLAD
jgi:hypothetical protein